MFGIGAGEFVVILIVALIVFGPSKLPEIGRGLGKVLREFRKAQAALSATLNEPDDKIVDKPTVQNIKPTTAQPTTAQPTTAQPTTSPTTTSPTTTSPTTTSPTTTSPTPTVTADYVINLAKDNPIVKESSDEKIFNGNPNDVPANDAGARPAGAGRSSDGTGQ